MIKDISPFREIVLQICHSARYGNKTTSNEFHMLRRAEH